MIRRCDLLLQYKKYRREIDSAINKVLASGSYVNDGELEKFELEFSRYLGINYGIGVANGTDGLTLSLMALGIQKGDEVITTPLTAIPTLSAIIDAGALPVFVDICPDTFLIDIDQAVKKVTKKTKAIIPVHIFGNVVDVVRLRKKLVRDVPIIEDACQAHGSKINNACAGTLGDVGVFSFYPTKNLGCYGDGGMVVTCNKAMARKIRLLRNYGSADNVHIVCHGINSRLDELQAAVLRVKLRYLDVMNRARNRLSQRYNVLLRHDLFECQAIPQGVYSNYYLFVTRFKKNRKKFMRYVSENGIQLDNHFTIPLHQHNANQSLKIKKVVLAHAESLCAHLVALPLYPELDQRIQDRIIKTVNSYEEYGA